MRRWVGLFFIVMLLVSALSFTGVAAQRPNSTRQWLVFSDLSNSASSVMASQIRLAGGTVNRSFGQVGVQLVTSSNANFANQMSALGLVAAPNRRVPTFKPTNTVRMNVSGQSQGGLSNPYFPIQWNLQAVRAVEGWQHGRRGQGAQVAVLDEGFYLNDSDLDANFNTRLAASFVPGETVQWTLPNGFSHGTHVSGIIAAEDNNIGTVGVAPKAQIIPVKVLSESLGYGEDAWVLAGMLYAASIHVDIVNMSLGGTCDINNPPDPDYDCGVSAREILSLKRMYNHVVKFMRSQGVTVIASAGNDAIDFDANPNLIDLPAQANGVLGISATGPYGWALNAAADPREPASYSNYGRSTVDFAAPGGDFDLFFDIGLQSCTVTLPAGDLELPCYAFDMVVSPAEAGDEGEFVYWAAGTSMAAPHVAGIAAQIVGANGGHMSPNQVENALNRYAENLRPKAFYGSGFARANR
ncbi:MAG: S8 family serine peptidase [Anaerolineae bacterium]